MLSTLLAGDTMLHVTSVVLCSVLVVLEMIEVPWASSQCVGFNTNSSVKFRSLFRHMVACLCYKDIAQYSIELLAICVSLLTDMVS